MNSFYEGYDFFVKNTSSAYGSIKGTDYVNSVEKEINQLNNDINSFTGYKTATDKLKGDIFEFWHSGTHNIDAAVKGKDTRTFVDRSSDLGSPDITGNFGKSYGLKNYNSSIESARQQAKTFFERYKEYIAKTGKNITYEEYLKKNGLEYNDPNTSLYAGQIRIIPKDQLKEAINWLEGKIEKEKIIRPDQAERYSETLKMLTDKIKSNQGTESIPLDEAETKIIAALAKEGGFDASAFGLTTEKLIKYKYVLNQAFKAGINAATISMVLKVAPEIYKAIESLTSLGEIDKEQLQRLGFATISGAAEGFIRGTVAAAVTTACKAGLWGSLLKNNADPAFIGVATVMVMNALQNSFEVAAGRMTKAEFADACSRDLFVSAFSLTLGGIVQGIAIEIPVLGFMIGSFVGSVVGSFVYNAGYKTFISFCVDSGFSFFGLVKQDYTLPDDVLSDIGIDAFKHKKFSPKEFSPKKFEYEIFSFKKFETKTIDIKVLRRGVVEVNRIGYI